MAQRSADYFLGIERLWLRWYDADGNWVPTPVEQENQQVDRLAARVEVLAAKLRELGVDPNQL